KHVCEGRPGQVLEAADGVALGMPTARRTWGKRYRDAGIARGIGQQVDTRTTIEHVAIRATFDLVVAIAGNDGIDAAVGTDHVGSGGSPDPVVAAAGDQVLEIDEALARVVRHSGVHVDRVNAGPTRRIECVNAGTA